MNNAIYFENDVSNEQYQMAVRVLEAINIAVKKSSKKEDDTKMTEQEFYDMINKAMQGKSRPLTDELRRELFDV